jgi:hypothetical protein
MRRTLLASGAAGLVALGASQGHAATTLYLDVDGCTNAGSCTLSSYGTATVTTMGNFTQVEIDLAANVYFAPGDNGLDAAAFDVVGSPNLTTTVMTNGFMAYSPHLAGATVAEGSLGKFQYSVDWLASANQHNLQQLIFQISANNQPVSLNPSDVGGTLVYLSADIEQKVNGTVVSEGAIGASSTPPPVPRAQGVPEPTVWALMLTGFFSAGSALRRRRGHKGV